MNSVIIIARLTKDVELCKTTSGISAVSMFVAINNGKDENGQDRPADFPKVVIYKKVAENVAKYCKKGDRIAIEGNIKTRTWDKADGTKGYETYIRANNVHFLNNRTNESNNNIPDLEGMSNTQIVQKVMSDDTDPFADFNGEVELSPEELPF